MLQRASSWSRGLFTTEDETTPTGYRQTTEEEERWKYKANEKALFDNDVDWINKYSEKYTGQKFSSDETPFRRPMSAVEVMAPQTSSDGDGVICNRR